MKTKIEIKSVFGKVLFTYEKESATLKEAVEQAVKEKIDLRYSDLRYSDFSGSDLRYSDLRYSNLSGSNLSGSDLRYSDLRYSNLSGSNLSGAKNKDLAYIPIHCKWPTSIKGDLIQIGCKEKTIEQWDLFFASNEEYSTKRGTDDFKQIHAVYLAHKAYLEFLK